MTINRKEIKRPSIEDIQTALNSIVSLCQYQEDEYGRTEGCAKCPLSKDDICLVSDIYPYNWNIQEEPVVKLML